MARILLVGVDLFLRGKLEALLPGHRLLTAEGIDPPDLVIADISRVDPTTSPTTTPTSRSSASRTTPTRRASGAPTPRASTRWSRNRRCSSGTQELIGGLLTPWVDVDSRDDVHHLRALHRHQGPLVRRRLPRRLHPRGGADARDRPRGVHRLRRLRARVPGRGDLPRGRAPREVGALREDQLRLRRGHGRR